MADDLNHDETEEEAVLKVPDRFEGLRNLGSGTLRSIIVPVEAALETLDEKFMDLLAAGRGAFMVLKGSSGAGKSTFLDTAALFREHLTSERITSAEDVAEALSELRPSEDARIVVLEGREALGKVSAEALEAAVHAVNAFVRSESGHHTLVVWPTNTSGLTDRLVTLGLELGGTALHGTGEPAITFTGPSPEHYVGIAERTVAALNEGASLATLGISEERAEALVSGATTIGDYLALIRGELLRNGNRVRKLMATEQPRVWTLVIAGNDPDGDVAALTRGGHAYADVDRMMTATGANIVQELKKQPDTLGILGTVLDARIIYLDMVAVLAIARQFGDDELHQLMKAAGMSVNADGTATDRITSSELGLLLTGETTGTRKRGSKPGSSTQAAFANLAEIARQNDGLLNKAIGAALVAAGLVTEFDTEVGLGTETKYISDLHLRRPDENPIRLEVMWRKTTSRAEIANYSLTKLGNYAKAIGLL